MPLKGIKYPILIILAAFFVPMLFGVAQPKSPTRRALPSAGDSLLRPDSTIEIVTDSLIPADSAKGDSLVSDTIVSKPFLDDVISGKNDDSLIYDIKDKMVYIYKNGEINYQSMVLKADYMRVNLSTKNIYAYGKPDTTAKRGVTRPEFVDGSSSYTMDTITYNLSTKKAKIKGVATQEGEGFLLGQSVKKMPNNTFNIAHGKYTTCDDPDCPHFYLHITKGKMLPGKKIIVGPSYLVMEGVPIYFLGLPFGFFPITTKRTSGFIMPSYGEEYVKGFFLRDAGYYFAFNDYIDASVTASIYTLGSWDASLNSRYIKRYKYSGQLALRFSKDVVGEKGAADYYNANNFSVAWSHQQDSKFRPNSTFSASVNFSTSGYAKYGSDNMDDYLNTQTNSSISYSKSWVGTPFSFSTNLQQSQNSKDKTMSISFPNAVFNMSRIFPFQRKNPVGKQRWYEKISMSYTGTLSNSVSAKEEDLFSEKMFKDMKNGVNHSIPISTTMNLFKYININPSASYTERWYFQKVDKEWSDETNQLIPMDTTYGFYRLFNYNFSVSASTKVYGLFQFGKKFPVQALRWVLTPNISFNYTPDFGGASYGYYKSVQTDSTGTIGYYSPFEGGVHGVPGRSKSAGISFGLQNTVEAKVLSKSDTSGVRKIKIIDNLSINSSYNLLADSMNLSPFNLNLRMTFVKNFGLNISAVLDPYSVDAKGRRYNRLMIKDGKIGRIASTGWSFGYTFNSKSSSGPAINDIKSGANNVSAYDNSFLSPNGNNNKIDPLVLRQMMTAQYYDFSIPWNLGFNYSMSFTNNGIQKNVSQTLGFNGSVNLTPKWGITFNGGYDFQTKKLTPGVFTLSRDLHCWQMSFNWVPVGFRKSWSFNIAVKSAMLKDLKYDKSSSFYDNILDN